MGDLSKLKVSVWNPFVPETALIMAAEDQTGNGASADSMRELPGEDSGLLKEVYGWRIAEDPFGGVTDGQRREELERTLREALSVDIQPSKRSVEVLRIFIEKAIGVINAGMVEWSGSQTANNEEENYRLNSLLSFINHLQWLVEIFDEQPSVSVTIR